ncbi:unnamed protein product [Ixodes pacificus]
MQYSSNLMVFIIFLEMRLFDIYVDVPEVSFCSCMHLYSFYNCADIARTVVNCGRSGPQSGRGAFCLYLRSGIGQ